MWPSCSRGPDLSPLERLLCWLSSYVCGCNYRRKYTVLFFVHADGLSFLSFSVMQSVVAHIQENDVVNPTIILLEERNRQKNINPNARWYVCSDIHLYISRNLLTNYSLEVITTKMCLQWPRGYVEEFVTHNSVIQH